MGKFVTENKTLLAGAIVIGRNEGERLERCLHSLAGQFRAVIYVDSGSTDGSVATARAQGADVVELDLATPFTAARARNMGFAHLREQNPDIAQVQFIDGDCELQPGWLTVGQSLLEARPDVVATCGRVRERHPEATIYNRLADAEWAGPEGAVEACGGIFLMRCAAFEAVGGFNSTLIAGEEPELCVRLRRAGGLIWRLNTEMALHDIAMTRFGQWWRRRRRAGFAYANGVQLQGFTPERHYVPQLRRTLTWGGAVPTVVVLGMLFSPWAVALLLIYIAQILRLRLRGMDAVQSLISPLGHIPEMLGVLEFALKAIRGRQKTLIEYR